jgi:hypothetical protein
MVTMMMTRDFRFRKRLARLLPVLFGLLALPFALPAQAATFNYSGSQRQIKACILYSNDLDADGDYDQDDFAPYTFYILDQRTDFKPAGWTFVNPLAPGTVSATMFARMQNRAQAFKSGNPIQDPALSQGLFRINAPLTKNMASYWEVNLDNLSATDLKQFNIILMPISSNELVKFTPDRAAKLRQFVDGGGTLWFEVERGSGTNSTTNFLLSLGFNCNGTAGALANLAASHHPLVSYPYTISSIDALGLGINPGFYHTDGQTTSLLANPRILVPILWAGDPSLSRPYVSAGDFGAGHLVVSSAGIASAISSFAGGVTLSVYGSNEGAISGENLLAVPTVDLKFGYNLVAWTSSVPTASVDVRRSGATQENPGSKVAVQFSSIPLGATSNTGSGAIIYKGVIFSVDGNNILHAYNAHPGLDLDNKGYPDTGKPDLGLGASYDEIWNYDLKTVGGVSGSTLVSTPTMVSFYDTTQRIPRDFVVVTTANGITVAFDAFPRNAAGLLQATTNLIWTAKEDTSVSLGANVTLPSGASPILIPSPALSEGVLFTIVRDTTNTTDTTTAWRIAALDPTTGASIFDGSTFNGGTNNNVAPTPQLIGAAIPGLSDIVGPLSVGYVQDTLTGAQDKMIYVPCAPQSGTVKSAGYVNGIWFSTRHEPMQPVAGSNIQFRAQGDRGYVPWYIPPGNGNSTLAPVLHRIGPDAGNPAITDIFDMNYPADFSINYVSGPGPNNGTTITLTNPLPAGYALYADYTVDWPADTINGVQPAGNQNDLKIFSVMRRVNANDPNAVTPVAMVNDSPALSPDGLLLFNTKLQETANSTGFLPDRIYAVREQLATTGVGAANQQAPTGSQIGWMFSPIDNPSSLIDSTGIQPRLIATLPNGLTPVPPNALTGAGVIHNFRAVGNPSVSNGVVYIVGKGWATVQTGSGEANPDYTVILALKANPDMSFSVGNLFNNLPAGTQLQLQQVDTTQAPGTVHGGVSPDLTLTQGTNFTYDPDTETIHIFNMQATSVVGAGGGDSFNTSLPIYVSLVGTAGATGTNAQQTLITNKTTGYGPLDNLLWWMVIPTAGVSNNGSILVPAGLIPTSGPSVMGNALYFGTLHGIVASVDIPNLTGGAQQEVFARNATTGLYDPTQLHVHGQAAQINTANGAPVDQPLYNLPVGASGVIAMGAPNGLAGLENQITLVADGERLLEVDTQGKAVWSLDSTRSTRVVGGTLQNVSTDSGQIVSQKIPLSHPNVAYRYTLNSFLIADTGNNRILQVDQGGGVTLEIHAMQNDMHFLKPGEPLTLNQPTDVQTITESSNALAFTNNETGVIYRYFGPYTAVHNIIADSGNYRALEIVSAYGPNGQPIQMNGTDGSLVTMQQEVVFVTRSLQEQNQRLRYRTIQEFRDPNSGGVFLIAAVGNESQAATDRNTAQVGINTNQNVKGQGGSLMAIFRNPTQPATAKDGDVAVIIDSITLADANGNVLMDNNGNPIRQAVNSPTWFKEIEIPDVFTGQVGPHYLLADSNGVYLLRPSASDAIVEWMLSSADYQRMTGRPLRAVSIQRLTQSDYLASTNKFYPHYLITNQFSGSDSILQFFGATSNVTQNGEVHGEVIEVRSLDYYQAGGYQNAIPLYANNGGFLVANNNSPIVWMAPNETIPQGTLTSPAGPIKRSLGSTLDSTSTYIFEGPTFSDRPF